MNIESIKIKLLVKYPFFGSIVANSNFISEQLILTASTDGKNIYYNPKYIDSITDEEKTFVFAHEICHIAFDHVFRSEGKDMKLWNIATDSVVNAYLKKDGLSMVEGAVDIPEAINYDAEEMYKKLLEDKRQQISRQDNNNQNNDLENEKKEQNSRDNNDDQNNSESYSIAGQSNQEGWQDENHDVGHDTHWMWNKVIEKRHQEEKSKSDFGQTRGKDEEIKKLTELGEKEAFKKNKIERKKQLEELRKSLASKSHGQGSDTNSEIRNITDIGKSTPLIDWRRLLKEVINYDVDWSYQNAEIDDGVVKAHLEDVPRPETEIVLDTSGSINETLLRNFLRECKNILKTSKVKVGCFDTKFYGFTEIKNLSDIDNLQFYGGGGTDFNVAVNAFTKRVENKIIFTDGEAPMPEKPVGAIWIVFGYLKINPKGGKVIYINEEQLNNLYLNSEEKTNGKTR